ncbi:hypothetical protein ACN9M0_35400 [Streptomyces sp. R-07]|uniref:hypothetical protein n=1 Tax=Streptomyces sp. R-07 TaxID=3404052 RepID=UPI003CF26015
MLRRELPVASWRRVTAPPLELCGGAELPAGAELLLMLMLMGSGSDPDVFAPPWADGPQPREQPPPPRLRRGAPPLPGRARLAPDAAAAPTPGLLSFRTPLRVPVVEPSPPG